MDSEILSHSFRAVELRSELNRVEVLLTVFAIFFALIVLRGAAAINKRTGRLEMVAAQ